MKTSLVNYMIGLNKNVFGNHFNPWCSQNGQTHVQNLAAFAYV